MEYLRRKYQHQDMIELAKEEVRSEVDSALKNAKADNALPDKSAPAYVVEKPANPSHGDLAVNIAMVSAKAFGMASRKIADEIAGRISTAGWINKVEVAGPGFINVFLAEPWYSSVVKAVCALGDGYGRTNQGNGRKINVEFVSANPTGPMHLGNARGGALGDTLAEVLAWSGYEVCREFYINDAGNQIAKFGKSLAARYLQIIRGEDAVPFPEDGYQGEDIKERAQEYYDTYGPNAADLPAEELEQVLGEFALPKNIQSMKDDLAKYRIHYDVWFPESQLHSSGAVRRMVDRLLDKGVAYKKDGTVWYKATEYGGEKDEVLVRSNGIPTYFAADIAYHAGKFSRGFDRAIDVWGADHHGHVARMKGAMDAIGLDGDKLDIVLMQFVRLMREGKPVRMSKRTGKAITLSSLLDEVPVDSARFFFNLREPGSQIEFDLDLAVAEDTNNPVYYVQYAHARICSILRNLEEEKVSFDWHFAFTQLGLLTAPEEQALIRLMAAFPGEVAAAAKAYDPARVTRYLTELAAGVHKFYTNCRVKGETPALLQARLALCMAAKTVVANGLHILKVSVPEHM